ncbi:MAG TPA: hypothetical protein VNF50_00715, partial [Acidimicrobiales bacterium]|nr:hypothetical protein [Acidimicrobiales bacterium]
MLLGTLNADGVQRRLCRSVRDGAAAASSLAFVSAASGLNSSRRPPTHAGPDPRARHYARPRRRDRVHRAGAAPAQVRLGAVTDPAFWAPAGSAP